MYTVECYGDGDWRVSAPGASVDCSCPREADARAIAAALDLADSGVVEALEALLLCLKQHEALGKVKPDPRWDAARAALARAKGE